MTTPLYVQYLIATIRNYTCTNLSDHLEPAPGTSHDAISDYLRGEKLTPRGLWELVGPLIENGPDAFLIVDDSVQNKEFSKAIELVKLQYSGAEHGLVRGINVVNLAHSTGPCGDYLPVDFRIYDDKHLTGSERCQCRKARPQRNHIACCYQAWLSINLTAKRQAITIYAAHRDLWSNFLREQLRNPQIKAYAG